MTAESVVSRFVQAGQTSRLRELATTHSDVKVRTALSRILPPAPDAGGTR
jgi:hypothetical protein